MKVMVAGGTGLVGSALVSKYKKLGHEVFAVNSRTLDLTNKNETLKYVSELKPDLIIDSAAKVGGIQANNKYPVDFININLQIQGNLMEAAFNSRIENFVFLGSSCIYPRECKQPIKEEYLMTGKLEETNSAYAVAKIAGIEFVKSVRKQYGLNWISVMPTNVYGPLDNFNLESSHVIPALIRKIIEAKNRNQPLTVWGDGSALREFIYSGDLADAIHVCAEKYKDSEHLNIGSGMECSIRDLVALLVKITDFSGEVIWDTKKPNGTPRKILDSSRILSLGWTPSTSLEQGIINTINWYKSSDKIGVVRF